LRLLDSGPRALGPPPKAGVRSHEASGQVVHAAHLTEAFAEGRKTKIVEKTGKNGNFCRNAGAIIRGFIVIQES